MSGGDGTYHAYVECGSEAPAFEVAAALKNLDWEPALTPQKRKLRFRTQRETMAREDCALCKGTGWKLVPRKDGAAGQMAVVCECGMEERAEKVMERARVPKRYEHCDFESYATDLADGKTWTTQHEQALKQAKLMTQGFVRDYPATEKGLLLMGPSGVGKTHLAVAALKELIRRGHNGLFCDYRELLKEIQASYNPASESTEMSVLEPVRTAEILVLDDLGASKPSTLSVGAGHYWIGAEHAL